AAHREADDAVQAGGDRGCGACREIARQVRHSDRRARLPNASGKPLTPAVVDLWCGGLIRRGVAAWSLPCSHEMHRLAFVVDFPVLSELPVERPAQTLEDSRGSLVPSRRRDERL